MTEVGFGHMLLEDTLEKLVGIFTVGMMILFAVEYHKFWATSKVPFHTPKLRTKESSVITILYWKHFKMSLNIYLYLVSFRKMSRHAIFSSLVGLLRRGNFGISISFAFKE